MKSIDEMCEVMQAGKTKEIESCIIQCSGLNCIDWDLTPSPSWNWAMFDYRVKQDRPKAPKRVWIAHEHTTGQPRWLLDVPDSTLSNAAEYVELTAEVKAKLGLT